MTLVMANRLVTHRAQARLQLAAKVAIWLLVAVMVVAIAVMKLAVMTPQILVLLTVAMGASMGLVMTAALVLAVVWNLPPR